jgi:hypothetical protein
VPRSLLLTASLDTHDIIETEANSSAAVGLALFSGCDILKSPMAHFSSSLLLWPFARVSQLYIRARKSFIISQYLYIQNRKPFAMNKSPVMPKGTTPHHLIQGAHTLPGLVYTRAQALYYEHKFVYTEPQAICYQRIVRIYKGEGPLGSGPPKRIRKPGSHQALQTSRNPLKAASERPTVSSLPARRKY